MPARNGGGSGAEGRARRPAGARGLPETGYAEEARQAGGWEGGRRRRKDREIRADWIEGHASPRFPPHSLGPRRAIPGSPTPPNSAWRAASARISLPRFRSPSGYRSPFTADRRPPRVAPARDGGVRAGGHRVVVAANSFARTEIRPPARSPERVSAHESGPGESLRARIAPHLTAIQLPHYRTYTLPSPRTRPR